MPDNAVPAYITSLIRHFEDLRDGTHGGSASRKDKEAHFEKAVQLLAPVARQVLTEMNTSLLLDTGQLTETGLRSTPDGGLNASWALSWPEQRAAGVEPIVLQAYFGGGFHHPHLRGTTVHDWPLNVFSDEDAAAQLSILRAIASSDLHNLVYRADYRIVPAVTAKEVQSDRCLVITTRSHRSAPFHGADAGSNPAGDANIDSRDRFIPEVA